MNVRILNERPKTKDTDAWAERLWVNYLLNEPFFTSWRALIFVEREG